MSKRGLSLDEKKTRMLQLFYEKGECFQLKELEKIAPKTKGIVVNSVKDVLQKLVEDGLVDSDKIGTSVYFWAFPSKAINTKKRKLEELQSKYKESCERLEVLEHSLVGTEEMDEDKVKRKKLLEEISDKELKLVELKGKLKNCLENDPRKLEELSDKEQELKDAANRWTDNIFAIKSWCKSNFSFEDNVLNKQFGIPEDLDYLS